jgi:hypothetical protein
MSKTFYAGARLRAFMAPALPPRAATPVRVMILDGRALGLSRLAAPTPVLKKELEAAGLFQVDVVSTAPPSGGDFTKFKPDFSQYQAIVLNYDGRIGPRS